MIRGGRGVAALCALASWFGLAAAGAAAAAPPNDDFANREDLGSVLPVEIVQGNVEATREFGEREFGGSGRSIWFKWTAPDTRYVTVDTCETDPGLRPKVGVFTGTAPSALTRVEGGSLEDRETCPNGRGSTMTFRAAAGVEYAIGADLYAEPGHPEEAEGPIELRVFATPAPPNDDFALATPLTVERDALGLYGTSAIGGTWAATKEAGEPNHAGDPGGASVWYSFTAASQGYNLYVCSRSSPVVFAVYTGDSVARLTEVMSQNECGIRFFPTTPGTTYRIAVDGRREAASGLAIAGSYSLSLMRIPPFDSVPGADPSPAAPQPDRTPPETTIRRSVLKQMPPILRFGFFSSEVGSSFRCSVDGKPFKSCQGSRSFSQPSDKRRTLKVYAVDAAGNADPTPAVAHFRIAPPRHRRAAHP